MKIIQNINEFHKSATKLDDTAYKKYKDNLDKVLDNFYKLLPYKHAARKIFSFLMKVKNNPDAESYEKEMVQNYLDFLNKNKIRLESYKELGNKIFNLNSEQAKRALEYKKDLIETTLNNIDALANSNNWNEFESKYKEQVNNYIELDDGDLGF